MSLDKSIQSGKEHRKRYTGAKAVDAKCRNYGSCKRCLSNRTHKNDKRRNALEQQLNEHLEEDDIWQQEIVKQHIIQTSGMDTGAISRKGHACFWFRIAKNAQICMEKDQMQNRIMKLRRSDI